MLTKDTLQELTKAQAISAAAETLLGAGPSTGMVALPADFKLHDLEVHMQTRRRPRGTMTTSSADNFAQYIEAQHAHGCTVFVSPDEKRAVAVLNLGSADEPGHADNIAVFAPKMTAAYAAMKAIANGHPRSQQQVAEYLEDWLHVVQACANGEAEIQPRHAIAAVRSITIDALRRVESTEEQLSATRSALESVKARSGGDKPLPTEIRLRFEPFQGLQPREFVLRLSVHVAEKPTLSLRVAREELHDEEMAAELVQIVGDAITEGTSEGFPVLIGGYQATR